MAGPLFELGTWVTGSNHPAAISGADVVVLTVGVSRSDVLGFNVEVIDGFVEEILQYAPPLPV